MKKYLTFTLLAVAIASCEDEPIEPTTPPTPDPDPTPFTYSGDNMAGRWQLDSVYVWDANGSNYQTQQPVTYMPSAVGGAFTMEIYAEVFNETTASYDKSTVVNAGDNIKVNDRPHGYLYGNGNLEISQDNANIGEGLANLANDQEATIYHFVNGGLGGAECLFRTYTLVNNNRLEVTASDVFGIKLKEYFKRVN